MFLPMKDIGSFCRLMLGQACSNFQKESCACDGLCHLKQATFQKGHFPNYTQPLVQPWYILRYGFAYIAEYYLIYKQLLDAFPFGKKVDTISFGCGCGLDYWGMKYAFLSQDLGDVSINYHGVDRVDWSYQDMYNNIPGQHNVEFQLHDMIKRPFTIKNDTVLVFPKSLCELNQTQLVQLTNVIEKSHIDCTQLFLISSHRSAFESDDLRFVDQIKSAICDKHGYTVALRMDQTKVVSSYSPISQCINGCYYPKDIREETADLRLYCSRYREGDVPVCRDSDCEDKMTRNAMTTNKSFRWCTYVLKKAS